MKQSVIFLIILLVVVGSFSTILASTEPDSSHGETTMLPKDLNSYHDQEMDSVIEILKNRIAREPFNLIASLLFLFAIIHTFISNKFTAIAHKLEHRHEQKIQQKKRNPVLSALGLKFFIFLEMSRSFLDSGHWFYLLPFFLFTIGRLPLITLVTKLASLNQCLLL